MIDKEEKALYDKLQTRLGADCIPVPNSFKFAKLFLEDKIKNRMIMCPFCLNSSYLTQMNIDHGLYQCNYCKNRMSDKTILLIFDIFNSEKTIKTNEFAVWVFGYRMNGFFQKIKFQEWTKKLYDLGISYDFWEKYKQLKGEYQQEKQEDE